jgi:hypothetical protein
MKKDSCNSGPSCISILLLVMVILQAVTLFYLIRPAAQPVYQSLSPEQEKTMEVNNALLTKVSELTTLPNTQPVIAEVLDIDILMQEHPINADVYKDAANGDKVIAYEDKLIIYREDDNTIVYEGKNPNQIMQEQYIEELKEVLGQVGALTALDTKVVPQLSTIADIDVLREGNPELFASAENEDKILAYKERLIIYRPSTNQIIVDTAPAAAPVAPVVTE